MGLAGLYTHNLYKQMTLLHLMVMKYFEFEKKSSTTNASTEMQELKYFDDNDKSIQSLKRHPIIFRMFLRYNTALPYSTPVDRPAGLTFTAHRNRLSDKTVEHLILL